MKIFGFTIEKRAENALQDLLNNSSDSYISDNDLLSIPALSGCINIICSTIAMIPIKMYEVKDDKIFERKDDVRTKLFNDDTKDLLSGYEMKFAIVKDYLTKGSAYVYINGRIDKPKSLNFVESSNVSVMTNNDPIFKSFDISVQGKKFMPYDFIKVLRKTKNGYQGTSVLEENKILFKTMYNTLLFENRNYENGGMKKGFLKSQNKLSAEALENLKYAWKNLFSNQKSNSLVLQDGLDYKELSESSSDLQLNENKKTNAIECCRIFNIPNQILGEGTVNDDVYKNFIKLAISPILANIESALNRDLLKEKEKANTYFKFDVNELIKSDLKDRLTAYSQALNNGIMTLNEVRKEENLENIDGMDVLSLSLGGVYYDINKKTYYTPNTQTVVDDTLSNITKGENQIGNTNQSE